MTAGNAQRDLFLPDRFDILKRRAANQLNTIIVPVEGALQFLDDLYSDLIVAGRGAFLILRGDSGSGKSTFLHTIDLFREFVASYSIEKTADLEQNLAGMPPAAENLRLLVVEGREALQDVSSGVLEGAVHGINAFLRSANGEKTIVVWPCNTDDLQERLVHVAGQVGGDALLGTGEPVYAFTGPTKDQYLDIAARTIATLNQGAGIHDFGVSDERAKQFIAESTTIGGFLNALRQDLRKNTENVVHLLALEQCRMWVVVAAATDPDNDVAALTRGSASTADIDRLVTATKANIVADLKRYPDKLGILGAVLDARILHLPVTAALSTLRLYANEDLKAKMRQQGLTLRVAKDSPDKLRNTDLSRSFSATPMGPRTRGVKVGPNTKDAFEKMVAIATSHDSLLNKAIGAGLLELGLITAAETEQDLGGRLARRTDLVCHTSTGPVRLEFMWRTATSRADIANYTLTKIGSYARAIGLLD